MTQPNPTHFELAQFDNFWATFNPKRTDDLTPGVADHIGKRLRWEASWIITEEDGGPYVGDWHCTLHPDHGADVAYSFVWAVLCDLDDVEIIDG